MIQKSIKISTKIKRGCLNNAYQIPRGSAPGLFIKFTKIAQITIVKAYSSLLILPLNENGFLNISVILYLN